VSLYIQDISLYNFRNYRDFRVSLDKNISIIVGKNGIGKTNIIEAIELLTLFDSFRNPSWDELVSWGENTGSLILNTAGDDRLLVYSLMLKENKRQYFFNGKKKNINEIIGSLPAVLFTPDDLQLVKGSAEQRRDAIDLVGIQLSKTYGNLKNNYIKIIKNRNQLFKFDKINQLVLDSWNEKLIEIGSLFFKHRIRLFQVIRDEIVNIYESLVPNEIIQVAYRPSWEASFSEYNEILQENLFLLEKEQIYYLLSEELIRKKQEEMYRRHSIVGPHRDEIVIYINGKDARKFGSQGQQRSIALAWKMAEVEVISRLSNQPPILLLDDVMSELDENRRSTLMNYIDKRVQTVITTTSLHYFNEETLDHASVIDLMKKEAGGE
jgi:DNA replication and repair protein RecF